MDSFHEKIILKKGNLEESWVEFEDAQAFGWLENIAEKRISENVCKTQLRKDFSMILNQFSKRSNLLFLDDRIIIFVELQQLKIALLFGHQG